MAQQQQRSFSISVPIEPQSDLPSFDQRVNTALLDSQSRGYDLAAAVYVPGGSLPPHLRLFFVRQ